MSERPIVLHLAAVEYGVRTLLLPQLNWLADQGYDVRVACRPEANDFGPELGRFQPLAVRVPRSPGVAMVRAAVDIAKAVREVRPDILHLHSPAAALTTRMLPTRAIGGAALAYTVHGFAFQWGAIDARSRLLHRVERWQAARTDALLFQSEEDFEHVTNEHFRSRLVHLGNGVADYWFADDPRRRFGKHPRLLFVGRLVEEKGILELLRATAAVPDVRLTVVGSEIPSERDGVAARARVLADELRLADRVVFAGFLEGQALRDMYDAHDVFVLPSHREGLPRSIIEAMARGLPVVTTDIRGCRELVEHGRNGLLVEPRSDEQLASAIRQVAAMSSKRLQEFSAVSSQRAEAYRESAVFAKLGAVYASLLSGRMADT